MDSFLEKLLTNGSPLVVLVVVVWIFLKYLKDDAQQRNALFQQMHQEHIQARLEAREAIKDNTKATLEASRATEQLARTLQTCSLK